MIILPPVVAVSPLRQRLIDEMDLRRFGHETQRNYIRDVGRFATILGRSRADGIATRCWRPITLQIESPCFVVGR